MELADLAVPAATVAAAAITGGLGLAAARTGRAGDDADLYAVELQLLDRAQRLRAVTAERDHYRAAAELCQERADALAGELTDLYRELRRRGGRRHR